MPAIRTQIYLTVEQRLRLDALAAREHRGLAELIREAVDVYLQTTAPDPEAARDATFGSLPHLTVPSRGEWSVRG